MTIDDLQYEQWVWTGKNFPGQLPHQPLLGVVEEVGELCHAILKSEQNIRGSKQQHRDEAEDAIGDIMIYLAGVCSHNSFIMQDCIDKAWAVVKQRDWEKNKDTGKNEKC